VPRGFSYINVIEISIDQSILRRSFYIHAVAFKMLQLALLKVLSLVSIVAASNFTNGPGGRLSNGGHTSSYEPILELSEVLIASELGENSTALLPHTSPNNLTTRSDPSNVFKRQDNRPDGALKCSSTEKCIDGSCCGAVCLSRPLYSVVLIYI
jgi:hypothetical protein